MEALGLALNSWDNREYTDPPESESKVELINGPHEKNNILHAKIKIEDDWHWDYTVRIIFYTNVPQVFSVNSGWTAI